MPVSRSIRRARYAALVALVFVPIAVVAVGSEDGSADRRGPRECPGGFTDEPGIGCVKRLPNGNLLVHEAKGRQSEVHGGDPVEPLADGALAAVERSPVCAGTPRTQALYAYRTGGTNRVATQAASIRTQLRRINGQLAEEAVESGDVSVDLRVECAGSEPSVVAVAVGGDGAYADVANALHNAGHRSSQEKYLVFADFASPGGYSGVGTFYRDERLVADNASMTNRGVAVTYGGHWGGRTPLHELGHNLGAVQANAPDASGAGHCDGGGEDVMCYNDGGSRWDSGHACTEEESRSHFDYCHNDYFDARPEAGEYLAGNWNIGVNAAWASFSNRFLAFGAGTPPPTTTTSTTASTTSAPSTTTTRPATTTTTRRCFLGVFC